MDQQKQIRMNRLMHEFLRDETVVASDFVARQPQEKQREGEESLQFLETALRHHAAPAPSEGAKQRAVRAVQQRRRTNILSELRARASRLVFQSVPQYAYDLLGAQLILNRTADAPRTSTGTMYSDPHNQRIYDQQAREAAERTLTDINLSETLLPPEQIAEQLGILVQAFPLMDREGCVFRKDDFVSILLNSETSNSRRRRFTCAHEIGHSVLHKTEPLFEDKLQAFHDFHSLYERQAHVFASHLLAPAAQVRPLLDGPPSLSQGQAICNTFELSLAASLVRVVTDSDWDCALVVSFDGVVQWSFASEYFTGFIPHGKQLPTGSVAVELESSNFVTTRNGVVTPRQWLLDDQWLLEESRRVQSGWIYTLIRPTKTP